MAIDYSLLTVEIATAILGLAILVIGIIVPSEGSRKGIAYLTTIGLLAILAISFMFRGKDEVLFDGMYLIDDYGLFFKQLFLLAAALLSMASYYFAEKLGRGYSEFFVLLVFATLGMMVMSSAGDFVTLYVGLELMTISFYILAGYKKGDSKSAEAGVKYLLLGALSSAIMLYGISLLYGFTGTTLIADVADVVTKGNLSTGALLAMVFLVAGFGFKISAVPFHMWSPDIYEGAPSPVTAALAVGSKAAAFAVFARVFLTAFGNVTGTWTLLMAALAVLTIVLGNLVAIPQTNVKRMLAYSSVAQAGYMSTALVAANQAGIKGLAFYSMLYLFATIGAFTVIINVGAATGSDEMKDYAGMAQRSPIMAAVLTVSMLSMAGIPPLAGFVGKFYLFSSLLADGYTYVWLVVIGLLMSMASVYYYLSLAKIMYLGEATDNTPITVTAPVRFTLLFTMIATIAIGVYPAPLAKLADAAAKALF